MASIVLGAVGSALGAGFGGTILGLSGAAIGGMIGSSIGSVIDSALVASLSPGQRIEGARLDSLRITSATEGAVIPRLYGWMRLGGNIIWATDFSEEVNTTRSGGKGGGPKVTTTEYIYPASFAIGLTEGPITGIGRIWADGKPMDMTGVTWRWYSGSEVQTADPFIAAKMGASSTPACLRLLSHHTASFTWPTMVATRSGTVSSLARASRTVLPRQSTTTRSATSRTAGRSCDTTSTPRPRPATVRIRSQTICDCFAASAAVGSSMRTAVLDHMTARAMATA
jgi:hypothetical protein